MISDGLGYVTRDMIFRYSYLGIEIEFLCTQIQPKNEQGFFSFFANIFIAYFTSGRIHF